MLWYEYRVLHKCRITEIYIYRNEHIEKQGCDSEWVNAHPASLSTREFYNTWAYTSICKNKSIPI